MHLKTQKPDFKVFINGILLEPAKKNGNVREIDEEIEGVGKVEGQIIIADKALGDEAKIYIRVFGRVVNESGETPIRTLALTHGYSYANKIYADINVNELDEAVLTNRAGFIQDNEKFVDFIDWLRKELNSFISDTERIRAEEEEKIEKIMVPQAVSSDTEQITRTPEFKKIWEKIEKKGESFGKKIEKRISAGKRLVAEIPIREKKIKSHVKLSKDMDKLEDSIGEIVIGNRKLKINVFSLGKNSPESSLTKDGKGITINKDNPIYKRADSISFDALKIHCLKAIIVDVALTMADGDLEVFKEVYDAFTKRDIKIK